MALLITQSLLSAWSYQFQAYDADAAENDFLRVLRREPGEQSPAMLAGIAFEHLCYRIANYEGHPRPIFPANYDGARKVAEIIRGGQFQVKTSRKIHVSGYDLLLYGVLDALKAGIIYDIKFKLKSFGSLDLQGSYTNSPQHPAYMRLVPEAREFRYLVSDGKDLYVETYQREDTPSIEDIIRDFVRYLDGAGLMGLYHANWRTK